MYKSMLSATHEAETERTESKVSARVKSASDEECKEEGTTKLKSKIHSLTAILKSSSFGANKLQGLEKGAKGSQCRELGRGRVNLPQILC